MPRGGARPGAGRTKGAPNKASQQRQAEVAASGITPLDYLLRVLRDEAAERSDRMEAAKNAAPYVHPRLTTVAVGQADDLGPMIVQWEGD